MSLMSDFESKLPTVAEVTERFVQDHLGGMVLANTIRGLFLESMLSLILKQSWQYVGGSYMGWDFEDARQVRLEVKQTAYRQTWTKDDAPQSKSQPFSIRRKRAVYNSKLGRRVSVETPYRLADIYLFARHTDRTTEADQRDPHGWEFAVVAEHELPARADTISEHIVMRKWGFIEVGEVGHHLDELAQRISARHERKAMIKKKTLT